MNWKKVKLGELATFVNGYPFKPTDWVTEGLPIIRIQNLTGNAYESNYFNGKIADKYLIKNGDILISWSASLGVYEWKEGDAWLNQHIFRVVFDKIDIDKKFFKYLILEKIEEMKLAVHGATMKHITKEKFDNFDVKLPDLATQKHIAEVLDKADAIREQNRQLLSQYDELLQSTFIELFGDGENLRNLSDITTKITDGVHSKPQYIESGIPFISVKNITNLFLDFKDCKYISKEDHEQYCKRCKPELNDILYTKVGATYGRAAIVNTDEEFSLYVSVSLIKPKVEIIEPKYLLAVLNTDFVKRQADKSIKGAGVPDLHLVEIKKFKIPVPPFHLQQHFAKIVEQIEVQKEQAKKVLAESEALFEGLLAKYFG